MVDANRTQIPLVIRIFDQDGSLRGDDEEIDIAPNEGRALDLVLDLQTCSVEGDGIIGACGNTLISEGAQDDRAEINFRVEVRPAIPVKFTLIIERVRALEDCGFGDEILGVCTDNADFYARINIDGQELANKENRIEDDYDISPNWEFRKEVDILKGTIPLVIGIYDEDDNDDDHADLQGLEGRNLNLTLDLSRCAGNEDNALTGDVNGMCSVTLLSSGTSDERAEIFFRVEVEAPPSTSGTNVRCLHSPIWPQATDTLTITAEALADNLTYKFENTDIEIWLNNRNTPFATTSSPPLLTATAGPFNAGDSIFYGCLVRDRSNGEQVWSGWRRAQVGLPASGRVVPLVYTGGRNSSVDLVFVADDDDYSGPLDSDFLDDIQEVIRKSYYNQQIYLKHQDKLNFWLALDEGYADDAEGGCDHKVSESNDYNFADTKAIVHTKAIRDCAPRGERLFSGEIPDFQVFTHETGHRPFGLADEYCNKRNPPAGSVCDGGYYQNNPFPNLYEEPENCIADITNLQTWDERLGHRIRTTADCKQFEEDLFWFFDKDWSVSEPHEDDLMVDNATIRGADARRIEWLFNRCAQASCLPDINTSSQKELLKPTPLAINDPRQDPVPEFDFPSQATSKSMTVRLDFNGREQVSVDSDEVVYGQSYARLGDPPLLRVKLIDDDGHIVEEYNAWHPLWESVWNDDGTESRIIRPTSTGTFVFPFSPKLKTMEVIDIALQKTVIIVDLKPAFFQFCANNPNDPDCLEIYLPLIFKEFASGPDLVIEGLSATNNEATITIKNIGDTPIKDAFWVDVYFAPKTTPGLNQPCNNKFAQACVVWGIEQKQDEGSPLDLPINPGETRVLTLDKVYFGDNGSSPPPYPVDVDVYARVDSVDFSTNHGAVLESNEDNNLFGPVRSLAGIAGETGLISNSETTSGDDLPSRE
jgi:hypothetical protein